MIKNIVVGLFQVNCYIIVNTSSVFIIDPGDDYEVILSYLESQKLQPTHIICTHGHFDHTRGLQGLVQTLAVRGCFLPLLAHAADAAYFGIQAVDTNRQLCSSLGLLEYYNRYEAKVPPLTGFLSEGQYVADTDWKVLHTPGHSPGSICLFSSSEKKLISGDLLFKAAVGRTDGFDADVRVLGSSLRRLLDLPHSSNNDTTVLPGHGQATSLSAEVGTLRYD